MTKYDRIRIIEKQEDIQNCFEDIDICVNDLWIVGDTIVKIKELFPELNIVSVCHSLIRMENITNLGSCYTNNFNQQEITFQNSDYVVLISQAYKKIIIMSFDTIYLIQRRVIYNSVQSMIDETLDVDYTSNTLGYIGRHVPYYT